jgi:predicted permease
MRTLGQDLRYAVRLLGRAPGFTAVVTIVLALGIGANSAIFSVVDAALLRPLPFARPSELVTLAEIAPEGKQYRVAPLNFQDWHDQNTAFTAMAAVAGGSHTLVSRGGAEQIPGQSVTSEFFDLLGVKPIAGRTFDAADERSHADVVVLSERMWRSRFASDPHVVGSPLTLDSKVYRVAGVVPTSFQILWKSDIWTLQTIKRSPEQRRMHYLQVIGRLKPGESIASATAAMGALHAQIVQVDPEPTKGWAIALHPLRETLVGKELRDTTVILAGIVGFVLLMACANVASLLLARGNGRAREIAVRASLGAGSFRLVRQLVTESLLLAVLGGVGGIALAWGMIQAAPAIIPPDTLPAGIPIVLDARVLAFALAATLATGVIFGLAPAWQLVRSSLAGTLRGAGRGTTSGNTRLLGGLAVAEVAIAVIVVAGAGLFLRTLGRLAEVDPGFHATRILTMHVVLPLARYPNPQDCSRFFDAAEREIENLPGVESISFGGSLPLTGWDIGQGFQVNGTTASGATHYQIVGARYFETLGIPLLAGRAFSRRDNSAAVPVAIINQEFARRYFVGRDPVGAHVRVHAMDPGGPKWVDREIVGVAGQVKVDGVGERENILEVYVPITQNPWYGASLAIRGAGDPKALTGAVRAAVAKVDKDLALTQIQTMDEIAYGSSARPRFRAELLATFAGLALLLSAVGVFGVLAFSVIQRTREFGIRMALGAQMGDVLRMVLSRGLIIAAGGVMLGLIGAALLAHTMSALLFGVQPLDPVAFSVAGGSLGLVAITAALIPALRASRVDPVIALRED